MTGNVTISIKDFDKLRGQSSKAEDRSERVTRAAKELEVFLSFMCTREHIQEYLDEFNRQSQASKIILEDGRAKIVFKDED
tara:strand:+ start:874 stop:1116 length:243 start_codon:yes stop_codon:yes gene_type:complete